MIFKDRVTVGVFSVNMAASEALWFLKLLSNFIEASKNLTINITRVRYSKKFENHQSTEKNIDLILKPFKNIHLVIQSI
jgi:hypothetical protein